MENRKINILLVEDDDVDIMNVQRALRRNHLEYPLHVARDGLEALQMLREGSVHNSISASERLLVLLDLNMPRMSGLEFLKTLRSDDALRSIPVIVLSTSKDNNDLTRAYEWNVAGYLVKPVKFSEFASIVAIISDYWSFCEMPG
jgi:CheY-like chemotaxis protein